ncbi:MAG: response regulator [bacterium]|nr:response regulator [bacterium]
MPDNKQKIILLVEDEAITAMVEIKDLKKYGYTVVHVLNGKEAIETVFDEKTVIDLILMDLYDREFITANYKKTGWQQRCDIIVRGIARGFLLVGSLVEKPEACA